jgi:hypothetical protein
MLFLGLVEVGTYKTLNQATVASVHPKEVADAKN